jgi:hypothetical protein
MEKIIITILYPVILLAGFLSASYSWWHWFIFTFILVAAVGGIFEFFNNHLPELQPIAPPALGCGCFVYFTFTLIFFLAVLFDYELAIKIIILSFTNPFGIIVNWIIWIIMTPIFILLALSNVMDDKPSSVVNAIGIIESIITVFFFCLFASSLSTSFIIKIAIITIVILVTIFLLTKQTSQRIIMKTVIKNIKGSSINVGENIVTDTNIHYEEKNNIQKITKILEDLRKYIPQIKDEFSEESYDEIRRKIDFIEKEVNEAGNSEEINVKEYLKTIYDILKKAAENVITAGLMSTIKKYLG